LGGTVHWAGKPHPAIYQAALALAETSLARPLAKEKVLAIGDALRTDVAGASGQGYDCLLVADGIHAATLIADGAIDAAALERQSIEAGFTPYAAIPRLVW
jgi:ribonucleotide monophosphatase NagD (HAD superfamily)